LCGGRADGRSDAEEQTRQHTESDSEKYDGGVNVNFVEARQLPRRKSLQDWNPLPRQKRARRAADNR